MTPETIARITTDRLTLWGQVAIEHHSTPVLMLSVGHDHHSRELNVHSTEKMSDLEVLLFLEGAAKVLSEKMAARIREG
jgi:hypothetical protein